MKTRIVVDNSIFVSALLGPTGASRQLLRQFSQQPHYQLPIVNSLFTEDEFLINRLLIMSHGPFETSDIVTLFEAFISTCQWIDTYHL